MSSHAANIDRKNRVAAAFRAFSASRHTVERPHRTDTNGVGKVDTTRHMHHDALCNRCDLRYALHRAKQCGFDALEENEQQAILCAALTNRAALPIDALRWVDSVNGEVMS